MASRSTAEWLELFRAHGYPCGRYNLPHEAVDEPQVRANKFVVDLDHPTIGRYTTSNMPIGFEALKTGITRPSPGLGEHTAEVMDEIGLSASTVARLRADGVIVDGAS